MVVLTGGVMVLLCKWSTWWSTRWSAMLSTRLVHCVFQRLVGNVDHEVVYLLVQCWSNLWNTWWSILCSTRWSIGYYNLFISFLVFITVMLKLSSWRL